VLDGGKIVFNAGALNAVGGQVSLATTAPNTFQGPVSGSATLTITGNITGDGNLTKSQNGALVLSGVNTFTGGTVISGGAVHFANPASVPSAGQIVLGTNTTVGFGFVVDQAFLASHVAATPNPATIALGVDNSNNLDFTTYSAASLGSIGNVTYSGSIIPYATQAGGSYGLGGGGGTLTVTSILVGNNALNIGTAGSTGTVVLGGANSFSGGDHHSGRQQVDSQQRDRARRPGERSDHEWHDRSEWAKRHGGPSRVCADTDLRCSSPTIPM
jgi:fibronectin-binding autotransporter adhesin